MTTTDPITDAAPAVEPYRIADETYLIPNKVQAGPDEELYMSSLVIAAEEPVVVDTGAPLFREQWLRAVSEVVDLDDVRWIFLSHDDGDHLGNMHAILDAAPKATVVANGFSWERASLEPDRDLPLERMIWLEEGSAFDAGDRRLHLFRPPIFDGPTTRGLFDEKTGVMWAVDSFAAFTTGGAFEVADLPTDLYDESFALFNSMISPWHQWLSPELYGRHVDEVEAIGATTIASAHGPVLRGPFIAGAFDRVRAMAGQGRVMGPGQELLDELVAQALTSEPAA